jgi:hypothetical protein
MPVALLMIASSPSAILADSGINVGIAGLQLLDKQK